MESNASSLKGKARYITEAVAKLILKA